jgi:hypothetical protein
LILFKKKQNYLRVILVSNDCVGDDDDVFVVVVGVVEFSYLKIIKINFYSLKYLN